MNPSVHNEVLASLSPTTDAKVSGVFNAVEWGKRMGLLAVVPAIEMSRRAKGAKMMKGRPITTEEFERMLGAAVERTGRVLNPLPKRIKGPWLTEHRVAEIVSAIGTKATVKVNTDTNRQGEVRQCPRSAA